MTGQELRDRREAAGVKQWELGAAMRVASTRISQIEVLAKVTPKTVSRYLRALAEVSPVANTTTEETEAIG